MERAFENQAPGYGRMALGIARGIKAKVSAVFIALKLPKPLVTVMTWAILISLGLALAGVIFFAAFLYFMLMGKQSQHVAEENPDGCDYPDYLSRPEFSDHPGNFYHQHWEHD